jgi:hypothetical protein
MKSGRGVPGVGFASGSHGYLLTNSSVRNARMR